MKSQSQKRRRAIRRGRIRASSGPQPGKLRAANVAISGGPLDESGHSWPIVLVEAGPAKLQMRPGGPQGFISADAIAAAVAAGVFEGADSYEDHPSLTDNAELPERSVRKKIGRVSAVRFDATLGPMGAAVGVWSTWDDDYAAKLLRAWQLKIAGPYDFSIYGPVDYETREIDGQTYDVVTVIHAATVDLVTDGAAGGRFLTQLAASMRAAAGGGGRDGKMKFAQFQKTKPKLAERLVQAGSFAEAQSILAEIELEADAAFIAELVTAREEHAASIIAGKDSPAVAAKPAAVEAVMVEPAAVEAELVASLRSELAEIRAARVEQLVEKHLTGFEDIDRKVLTPRLRAAASDEAMAAVAAEHREYIATRFTPDFGMVRASGGAEVVASEYDTFNTALDGFLAGIDQKGKDGKRVARFSTLTEAIMHFPRHKQLRGVSGADVGTYLAGSYCARVVNPALHPEVKNEPGPYVIRGDKYIPIRASVTTQTFGENFADRAHKSFMGEYEAYANTAELEMLFSETREVDDFKAHRFIQIGGYANMPSVVEGGTYSSLVSPADREESGTLVKYGAIEDVTFEALRDPDGARIAMLPRKMGSAMGRTYREACLDSFTTDNPTMSDSDTLYHANHSNTGTSALTLANLDAIRLAMFKQTEQNSSKRLGSVNAPRFLFVPPDLVATAERVLGPSDAYLASVSNAGTDTTLDPRYWSTKNIQIVVLTHHTDTNNYFVGADPAKIPILAKLSLRGVPQPEFFQQFDPSSGSMFDADKGKWKVRYFWDFVPLDWVGLYRQVVA